MDVPKTGFLPAVVQSGDPIDAITAASVRHGVRAPDFDYAGRRAWLTKLMEAERRDDCRQNSIPLNEVTLHDLKQTAQGLGLTEFDP